MNGINYITASAKQTNTDYLPDCYNKRKYSAIPKQA